MFLEEALDVGREDTDDDSDVARGTPAIDVAGIYELPGLELKGAPSGFAGSPALSTKVLRAAFAGGGILCIRALVADADNSCSLPGEGILLGGRMPEANCNIGVSVWIMLIISLGCYRSFIARVHGNKQAMYSTSQFL